jgi:probable HAF family extracellular repeat protein
MTDLGTLGGLTSTAAEINERGQIAGAADVISSYPHAVLWEDGEVTDLGTLGGHASIALSINDAGIVVGWSETADLVDVTGSLGNAFRWDGGELKSLESLGGAELWGSWAVDVNAAGDIVGVADCVEGEAHAALWSEGVIHDLGVPGEESDATGINDTGQVVGWQAAGDAISHAVLWTPSR